MATNSNSSVTLGSVFSGSSGVTPGNLGSTYVVSISSTSTDSQVVLNISNASGVIQQINIPTGGSGGSGTGGNPVTSVSLVGTDLIIDLQSGTQFSTSLASLIPSFMDDNDFLTAASLDTDNYQLQLSVLNQTPVNVDLSPLVQASPIVNTGSRTYVQDDTTNQTRLTITGTQAVLTAIAPAPVPANAPTPPAAFNELVENTLSYDPPAVPAGGTLDSTNINSITITDNQDSETNPTLPTPAADGSFTLDTPAGTQQVDVDISYTTTDSNGNTETLNTNLITDAYVPYYTFSTVPTTTNNTVIPTPNTESSASLMSGTQFMITTTGIRRRWLIANQTGLTFQNNNFPVDATELSGVITVSGVTYYQYDFGVAIGGTLTATVV